MKLCTVGPMLSLHSPQVQNTHPIHISHQLASHLPDNTQAREHLWLGTLFYLTMAHMVKNNECGHFYYSILSQLFIFKSLPLSLIYNKGVVRAPTGVLGAVSPVIKE